MSTMVEVSAVPYDQDCIPLVTASVVSIDAELSDPIATAEAISEPSTQEVLSNSSSSSNQALPSPPESIPEEVYADDPVSSLSPQEDHSSLSTPVVREEDAEDDSDEGRENQRTIGAAVTGAILGYLVGGRFTALLFGIGTAYYYKEAGAAGDVARALGDIAMVARDRFREVDAKHHLVDKGAAAASEAVRRISEAERKHKAKRRAKKECLRFAETCWKHAGEFAERNHLAERGYQCFNRFLDRIVQRIRERRRQGLD